MSPTPSNHPGIQSPHLHLRVSWSGQHAGGQGCVFCLPSSGTMLLHEDYCHLLALSNFIFPIGNKVVNKCFFLPPALLPALSMLCQQNQQGQGLNQGNRWTSQMCFQPLIADRVALPETFRANSLWLVWTRGQFAVTAGKIKLLSQTQDTWGCGFTCNFLFFFFFFTELVVSLLQT